MSVELTLGADLGGRYTIGAELGRGGMGVVYRARDRVLQRDVAIKITHQSADRFYEEARLVAQLDHPNIVPVFDFGTEHGSTYIVMPLLEGPSLRDALDHGPVDLETTVRVGRAIAAALQYSHERGIVHRDVKPDNIMLSRIGNDAATVRLMDFGIAVEAARAPAEGPIAGTPEYLSPEQLRGEVADARSDIYSLGVVLYECVARNPPFQGELSRLAQQIFSTPAPSLVATNPNVGVELDAIVASCLAKSPGERPQSAAEVGAALEALDRRGSIRPGVYPVRGIRYDRDARTEDSVSSIAGRTREIDTVLKALDHAARHECGLVLVRGPRGIGKSRFLDEIASRALRMNARVLRGRYLEHEDDIVPYEGIAEAFSSWLSAGGPDAAAVVARLEPILPDLFAAMPTLVGHPAFGDREIAHEKVSGMVFDVIARAIAAFGDGKLCVVMLDDVHAANASLTALRYAFHRLASSPTLFVVTARHGAYDDRHPLHAIRASYAGHARFTEVVLGLLDRHELGELALRIVESELADELADELYRTTQGNPLIAVEIVEELRRRDLLLLENGRTRLAPSCRSLSEVVSDDVRALLRDRIARMGPREIALAERLACLGQRLEIDEARLLSEDVERFDRTVDELVRARVLVRDGTMLEFTSPLVREVVQDRLEPDARRAIHQQIAERLEARYGLAEDLVARLVQHYTHARRRTRALELALLASERALEARCPEDVIEWAGRLRESGTTDPAVVLLEAKLDVFEAKAHRMRGDVSAAMLALDRATGRAIADDRHASAIFEEAAQLAWRERDLVRAATWTHDARTRGASWFSGEDQRRLDDFALELANAAESGTADAKPREPIQTPSEPELLGDMLLVRADYLAARESYLASAKRGGELSHSRRLMLARLAHHLARYDEAIALAEETERATETTAPALAVQADTLASLAQSSAGRFVQAKTLADRAAARLASIRLPEAERMRAHALVLRSLGNALQGQGAPGEAASVFLRGLALLDPEADPWEHSIALFNTGHALLEAGELERADEFLKRATFQKVGMGDHWGLAHVHWARAALALTLGEIERAEEEARRGLDLSISVGDPRVAAMNRTVLGECATERDDLERAEAELQRAHRDADRCGANQEIVLSLVALSRVHVERGRSVQARNAATTALAHAENAGSKTALRAALVALARGHGTENPNLARSLCGSALEIAREIGDARGLLAVDLVRAEVETDPEIAVEFYHRVLDGALGLSAECTLARACLALARIERDLGRVEDARRSAEMAVSVLMGLNAVARTAEARAILEALPGAAQVAG
jgi:tRNA A-37 threonylcarbamoyl transferase component Bud32/tetratricopeptide (TPR) repeat protein